MPYTVISLNSASEKPCGAIYHFNGKVYCGCVNGSNPAKGYIFNPDNNTFTSFTLPTHDYYPRALTLDGRILYTAKDNNNRSWLLVNEDGTYTTLNDWNYRTDKACLTRDGKILIALVDLDNFGLFNPRTNFLEFLPNKPNTTSTADAHGCTLLPDGKFFLTFNNNGTSGTTQFAFIFNPFNNEWSSIDRNGVQLDQSYKNVYLYDGGLVAMVDFYGLHLINIYNKKIIDSESRYTANQYQFNSILPAPDGDIFVVGSQGIQKYNVTNNIVSSVSYSPLPADNNTPVGACILPSGNIFYSHNGSAIANNSFVIWTSSLGTLPNEVCLSAFYNRS